MAAVLARATGPSWSFPTRAHGAELELSDARTPGRAGAVRRGRHRGRAGAVRRGRHRGRAGAVHRAPRGALELSDVRATGPSWSCPTCAPPGRAGRGDDGCRPGARHRPELEPSDARATGPSWSCPT
jgi:hypothetical protein